MQQFIAKMKDLNTVDMCLCFTPLTLPLLQTLKLHQWEEDDYGYLQV